MEPAGSSSCGRELAARAAVGDHRPVARGGDRDHHAGASADRPATSTPRPRSSRATSSPAASAPRFATSRAAAPSDAPTRRRSPPARRPVPRRRHAVVAGHERLVEARDHVQEQVAESRDPHGTMVAWTTSVAGARLRSFALGGLVGAAGDRDRPPPRRSRRPRDAPAGLAAFEDAPCFLELVGGRRSATARAAGDRPGRRTRVAVGHEVGGGDHVAEPRPVRGRSAAGTTPGTSGRRT